MYTPKAARLAARMGYKNVLAYVDGLPGWQGAGQATASKVTLAETPIPLIKPAELSARFSEFHVVDIRWEERRDAGLIPGTSRWAPLTELDETFAELPRDKPLVLYDTTDKLTLMAGRFLRHKGFQVMRLDGGILNWVGSGFEVARVEN